MTITPLVLTQEHKDKLLEMCETLFPDHSFTWQWDAPDGTLHFNKIVWNTGEERTRPDCGLIHWFEFCMTHLVNALYYPDNVGKRDTRRKVEYFFFQSFVDAVEGASGGYTHPIDYLYSKFKGTGAE